MNPNRQEERPFHIKSSGGPLKSMLTGLGAKVLGLSRLDTLYRRLPPSLPGPGFSDHGLKVLGINIELAGESLESIPKEGPLVLVANHPFGGLEGLAMIKEVAKVRPDLRIMANNLLHRIPELRETVIPVDVFGSESAVRRNIGPLRQCLRWLTDGGALGIFPAGQVATFNPRMRAVVDPPWSETVGRLVRRSKATVVPIHYAGRNSLFFQTLSQIHPLLRTLMLGRELLNKKGRTIRMCVGSPIPADKLARIGSDRELIDHLRARTGLLAQDEKSRDQELPRPAAMADQKPVVEPEPKKLLVGEIANLPPGDHLLTGGEMEVYLAPADRIPHLLREIGRLRETTFRQVGEGTGSALDLDSFDQYYHHLFIWHREDQEVVGAYRLGRTDRIVEERGISGLYTSTLFRFSEQLLEEIAPAVEVGRSFIQPRYQRSYAPLLLLWKGIGHYVCDNPECTGLFGPVSISGDYRDLSRHLLVHYLTENRLAPDLARLCRARNPLKRMSVDPDLSLAADGDLDSISDLIMAIEDEARGVPVLVRQYLKLGARFLGFNVDQDFSQALDGLLYVDLTKTPPRILERYMGKKRAAEFLAHHETNPDAPAA